MLVRNDCHHDYFKFCKNLSGINDFTLTYLYGGLLILRHGVDTGASIQHKASRAFYEQS